MIDQIYLMLFNMFFTSWTPVRLTVIIVTSLFTTVLFSSLWGCLTRTLPRLY